MSKSQDDLYNEYLYHRRMRDLANQQGTYTSASQMNSMQNSIQNQNPLRSAWNLYQPDLSRYRWYNDETFLRNHNLETYYDAHSDVILFRRTLHVQDVPVTTYRGNISIPRSKVDTISIDDIFKLLDEQMRLSPDYIHQGPTNRQLEDPTIKAAWEEYRLILKLKGF